MEHRERSECLRTIDRINTLLNCGIFNTENADHVLLQSAYIELVICLRDLLHKTEKFAGRIAFTDDVQVNDYVKDVHDAVTAHRDAACHINSFKHRIESTQARGAFNVQYGIGCLMRIGSVELRGEYPDDTAVFYGTNRLYLRRHIVRCFNEAQVRLAPHLE
jgi:hypothetical protein